MREEWILTTGWKFLGEEMEDGHLETCAEDGMEEVTIPHDWAVGRPYRPDMRFGGEQGYLDREGIGWYRNHVVLDEKKAGFRYGLTFDGVYELAAVWVNGRLAGEHRYGYSGFTMDVTDLLKEGNNLLAVKVDNSKSHPDRWYSGAGIYRRVHLSVVPDCHIREEDICLETETDGSTGLISARVPVAGGADDQGVSQGADYSPMTVTMEVFLKGEPAGKAEIPVSVPGSADLQLSLDPVQLWDADHPVLYDIVFTLTGSGETDAVTRKTGFRKVVWSAEKGVTVNGVSVNLKGVCLHHDAGCLGAAAVKQTWYQRLKLLKDMGCNAIRTSHNIPDAILMDLCDEMGFYVLEEFTDKWKDGSYGRFFDEDWKTDLSYMVKRDRHRPSVVAWSVGNEVDRQGSTFMIEILGMLVKGVKDLDGSRPVTCALSPHYAGDDGVEWLEVSDRIDAIVRIAAKVDILALNYQEQWYELLHERLPEMVILGSEIYMFFKGHEQICMNYSMDHPWMDVERHSYVTGGFVWAGIDYLGESMGYPSKGWGGCLVKSNLVKKPVAYLWESYWSSKPMVYFCVQDYTLMDDLSREHWSCPRLAPHWNFEQYGRTVIPYMIFSNCEEVRLYVNGVRYYVKRPAECESRIISGFLPYVPGNVTVAGINKGEEVCRYELSTAKTAVRLALEPDRESVCAHPEDLLSVLVSGLDQAGTVSFREHALVHMSVEGPAVFAGADNGDLMDTYAFQEQRVRLHWGKAVIVLKPTGETGSIRLTVWADGFLPVSCQVEARQR